MLKQRKGDVALRHMDKWIAFASDTNRIMEPAKLVRALQALRKAVCSGSAADMDAAMTAVERMVFENIAVIEEIE